MKCNCLSDEERKFLYKCVLRHHKENGSSVEFKRNLKFSERNFLKKDVSQYIEVHEYLIGPMWNVCFNCSGGGHENEILSSVFYINLVDLLYDSKFPIFKRICGEIINAEFSYISGALEELSMDNPTPITKTVKEKINEVWEKYNFLLIRKFDNIPVD